jgi:RimJ/RimL family protein N-acetyltransferase
MESELPATIEGEEFALRRWQPEDADWYVSARDTEVYRFTTESATLTVDEARRAIERYREHGDALSFALVERQTGVLLGNVSLSLDGERGRSGEVSYWLAPQARGQGAASAGVRLLTRWAWRTLPMLEKIELNALPANLPSQRVAERCGFRQEGLMRHHKRMNGQLRDVVLYSMTRDDSAG